MTAKKIKIVTERSGEFIATLREDWRKDYGSVTKITEFFKKFLKKEEKIKFIKSIRYLIEVPELPPKHMESIDGKTAKDAASIFENWKEKIRGRAKASV